MNPLSKEVAHRPNVPQPKSISLVLPAWNEADALPRALAEADIALRAITSDYEIIVVDDGSHDGTAAFVERVAADNSAIRLVRHQKNQGYGAALRTGFAAAKWDLVVFTDADNQFDLSELDRFVLLSDDYQIVCGYRIDRKDSALRCFYSRAYNLLVRLLLRTGIRDVDCALKMFHREVVQDLAITTDGFLVNSELLTQARQRGYSVVEVGVTHRPRTEGQSTVSVRHIPNVLSNLLRYWWNHVQFPGAAMPDSRPLAIDTVHRHSDRRYLWGQVLLLVVAALLLLTGLSYPLIDRDETRYAEIPREMVASGNWIVPQLNFHTYYDKPALLYWLCAASYSLFGVAEWSARLVPALCGLATLASTMWFANRRLGARASFLAGLVLLFSVGFLGASRVLLIDGLLTCCVTISLLAAFEAMQSKRLRIGWWLTTSIACGLGFMAKGPIALVLLVPPVFAFGWLTQCSSRPKVRHWLLLTSVVAIVTTPWFVAVSMQDSSFAYEFFYKHNVTRFGGAFHVRPFWYFLPVLMIGAHPWSFLSIAYVGFLGSSDPRARQRRTPVVGYLILWSVWCFTFFSISRCKLPLYILPAAPALALMIGQFVEQVLFTSDENWYLAYSRKWAPWLAGATTCVAGVGFAIFALLTRFEIASISIVLICTWIGILAAIVVLRQFKYSPRVGWAMCVGSALLLAAVVLHRDMPRYARARTVFGDTSSLVADIPNAMELPIATVGHEWSGVPFALGRNDIQNYSELDSPDFLRSLGENDRMIVIMRSKDDVAKLQANLPENVRIMTIASRGPARVLVARVKAGRAIVARPTFQDSELR